MSRRSEKKDAQLANYENMLPRGVLKTSPTRTRQYNTVYMYFHLLEQLAVSRFTWSGLPAGIDSRFIELMLFENGSQPLIFFKDLILGRYMVTQCSFQGWQNAYYNPTKFTPYALGYSYRELYPEECVPIWDNMLREPMYDVLWAYATRLAKLDRSFDMNIENSVMPVIVTVSESQKLSVENILRQKSDGVPVIVAYDNLDATALSSQLQGIQTAGQYLGDKLLNAKAQVWNEAISYLGINNSNTEKKERLISDEVEAGAEKTDIFRYSFIKARREACEQINAMFGFDGILVGVDWTNDVLGDEND